MNLLNFSSPSAVWWSLKLLYIDCLYVIKVHLKLDKLFVIFAQAWIYFAGFYVSLQEIITAQHGGP